MQRRSTKPDADRRIRQADRLARVLKVLELIQGRGRWNPATLAQELGCSERTVHRYLNVLLYAGVPYWYDRAEGCYRLRPNFTFPVLNLSQDELLGQAVATAVTSSKGFDVSLGARPTTRKVSAVSGESAARLLEQAASLVKVLDLKLVDHSRHYEAIRTAQWALLSGKQLSGLYASPYYSKSFRLTLHPYRLCLVRQAWYLIARPTKEADPKTYRIVRFKTLRMLDQKAETPADFDLGAYFGNAWSVFRGDKSYDVEIHFTKDAATQVTETVWHHTQTVKRHRNGSVTLSFKVDGLDEILWWLLGWTGFAEVVQPMELRSMLLDQLRAGIEMHSPSPANAVRERDQT